MDVKKLEEHIRTLATVAEAEAPFMSCYLDLSKGVAGYRDELDSRIQLLEKTLPVHSGRAFEEVKNVVEMCLYVAHLQRTKGLAVFARGGAEPFFLSLAFEVPLPNWIGLGSTPNIYHLVELKDNYDRYVILLMTETSSRIIGINLGEVTEQLWRSRPDLRRQVGHEWTKDHYQEHRRERTKLFINDQIHSLDKLISAGGYTHLMLAGNERMLAAIRKGLPKRLADKLVGSFPAGSTNRTSEIVASTLQAFLKHEEQDSQTVADKLITQIHQHGLAMAGTQDCMDAIRAGQADVLVMAKSYDPGQGWECRGCGHTELQPPSSNTCPKCKGGQLREFDIRGEIVRLAEQQQLSVEIVEQHDVLMRLGGIGCLLRYLAPANYMYSAA